MASDESADLLRGAGGILQDILDCEFDPHALLEPVRDTDGQISDFRYLMVNQALCDDLGVTRDDLVGHTLLERFPQAAGGLFQGLITVLETGEPLAFDEYSERSGRVAGRAYDLRARRLEDCVDLVLRNVSEWRHAAEQLAASQEHFRLLAENASDVVYMTDVDDVFTWVSPSVVRFIGLRPEQIVGRPLADFVHPYDLARVYQAREGLRRDQPLTYVARLRTEGGGWVWGSVSERQHRDARGELESRVASIRDVGAEVDAREALASSEARYRSLSESSPSLILIFDRAHRVRFLNRAAAQAFGREHDGPADLRLEDLLEPRLAAAVDSRLTAVFAGGEAAVIEHEWDAATGHRHFSTYVGPVLGSTAEDVAEVIAVASDVTDIKRAEIELREANERLEFVLRASGGAGWEIDVTTGRHTWSPHMYELFGVDPGVEPGYDAVTGVIHPDDLDRVRRAQESALAEHAEFSVAYRIVRPDGEIRWLDGFGQGVYDERGEPVRMLGIVIDVTEHRRALAEKAGADDD